MFQIGARRCHDPTEQKCIAPQLGSGPGNQTSGSGYYTAEDYKEILRHAVKLHIEVIPEFDMPGHARAAIKAMEARAKQSNTRDYVLTDDNDPSTYFSAQMFTDNAINPCLNSSYTFIDLVLTELQQLHQGIQDLQIFNFGGDEVANGAWENSTACKNLMNSDPAINDVKDLKKYFAQRVADIVFVKNLSLAAWEDGLMKNASVVFNRNDLSPT